MSDKVQVHYVGTKMARAFGGRVGALRFRVPAAAKDEKGTPLARVISFTDETGKTSTLVEEAVAAKLVGINHALYEVVRKGSVSTAASAKKD